MKSKIFNFKTVARKLFHDEPQINDFLQDEKSAILLYHCPKSSRSS